MIDATEICCLCGNPATQDDPLTREHVPAKQFYPKSLRKFKFRSNSMRSGSAQPRLLRAIKRCFLLGNSGKAAVATVSGRTADKIDQLLDRFAEESPFGK